MKLLSLCLLLFGLASCAVTEPVDPNERLEMTGPHSPSEDPSIYEIPTLTPLENGNIVVRFKKTGCSVLFDHDGKLLEGGRHCDDVALFRARKAVKAHIAERESDFLGV